MWEDLSPLTTSWQPGKLESKTQQQQPPGRVEILGWNNSGQPYGHPGPWAQGCTREVQPGTPIWRRPNPDEQGWRITADSTEVLGKERNVSPGHKSQFEEASDQIWDNLIMKIIIKAFMSTKALEKMSVYEFMPVSNWKLADKNAKHLLVNVDKILGSKNSYCSHHSGSEVDEQNQWLLSQVKLQRTECTHDLKMSF